MPSPHSKVPKNETVLDYAPGSVEAHKLKESLDALSRSEIEVPLIINGKEVRTGRTSPMVMPHRHRARLGIFHKAGTTEIQLAIEGALVASSEWSRVPSRERSAILLKAADLLAGRNRWVLNASTMLGQSKTSYQAEIDAACEMIDFFRFNAYFLELLEEIQPFSTSGQKNRLEYRPLEGFVFAVSPFNFTSIGGNLPSSVALMGNVALWKPASASVYSNYYLMKLLMEAGLPPGVIQFIPGDGSLVGELVLKSSHLAGIHFTGSTAIFQSMWRSVGTNISHYRSYPRLVGETGGKNFVLVHPSANQGAVVAGLVRGAFEYQGHKCSAASRAYIPKSLWKGVCDRLIGEVKSIRMGDVSDFRNFMGAVIDKKSMENIRGYLDGVKGSTDCRILVGGRTDDSEGYFVEPTVLETTNPKYRTMCEEIFGPVLTVFPYDDDRGEDILTLIDETSPYALTGAIFAEDRDFLESAAAKLNHSAGNLYLNNKPTGAVVGQQPFGGARGSGTNDKAGSIFNLIRWVSMRTVSETLSPPTDYRYPFLEN